MMHTKKIALIPYNDRKKPAIMKKLSTKIKKVDKGPADVRLVHHNQALQKYNAIKKNMQRPYEIAIKEMIHPISDDVILKNIPKTQLKNATKLLNFIKKSPLIDISNDGNVSINGNILKGADIVSLINDFSRNTKNSPVSGAKELAEVLKESFIPLEIIGNKQRHDLFNYDDNDEFFFWDE